MLALHDRDPDALQAPELATPETEADLENAAAIEQSQDGVEAAAVEQAPAAEVPAVAVIGDGAALQPGQTASEQAFGDKPTAQTGQVDGGMFHPDEYHAACIAAGTPEKWDDRYYSGHTSAAQWIQPHDGPEPMVFDLKHGQSASQAVKDFLVGPTIADYRVIDVAAELDELRDTLGDQTFDRLFGSADGKQDAAIASAQRLRISSEMYTLPFWDQMMEIAAGESIEPSSEPAPPVVAAGMDETEQRAALASHPAPEAIAAELGVVRDEEFA